MLSNTRGPPDLDDDRRDEVLHSTLGRYRKGAQPSAQWLADGGHAPTTAADWDDLVLEGKGEAKPTKGAVEQTLASDE